MYSSTTKTSYRSIGFAECHEKLQKIKLYVIKKTHAPGELELNPLATDFLR